MDNCSVMRGVKTGLETKIRGLNKHLLDVSGDTVHMVNNAAKKFFFGLDKLFSVSELASDVFYDIEDSPKARELFGQLQMLIFKKKLTLIRPMPTRFLQMKDVCDRLVKLMDGLKLFYSSFLNEQEKTLQKQIHEGIFTKFEMSVDDKTAVLDILDILSKHKKTDANKERKERIIGSLFNSTDKTVLFIQLFRGILSKFQAFVTLFQSNKPMCHTLHFEMFKLVKSFYGCFMDPQYLPEYSAKQLGSINVEDRDLQLQDRHLSVGEHCHIEVMKCLRNKTKYPWLKTFFHQLRIGYIEAAKLLKKLPLANTTLQKLAYLDSSNQRCAHTISALTGLAELLPNVIPEESLGKLSEEIREYTTRDEVSLIDSDSDDKDFRIDVNWWSPVFALRSKGEPVFPLLTRLVKALLSIFTGPLVEGSFNIMGDIIEEDRTRLTIHNYEALAVIKSYLSARSLKATTMKIPPKMLQCVTKSYSSYTQHLQGTNVQQTQSASMPTPPSSTSSSSTSSNGSNKQTSEGSVPVSAAPLKRKQASLTGFFNKKPKL